MEEVWKTIPSWPTHEASNLGRVRVKSTKRIMPGSTYHGYTRVNHRWVHRCVLEAFVGEASGLYVDHINGDRNDNRLCNLRYATSKLNNRNKDGIACGKAWDPFLETYV